MQAELPCLGIACNEYRFGRRHAGLNGRSRSLADDPLVDAPIAAVLGGSWCALEASAGPRITGRSGGACSWSLACSSGSRLGGRWALTAWEPSAKWRPSPTAPEPSGRQRMASATGWTARGRITRGRSCGGPEPGISAWAGSSRSSCELFELDTVVGGDHLGRLFADHDRSGVGIAAGDIRHDAGISHP